MCAIYWFDSCGNEGMGGLPVVVVVAVVVVVVAFVEDMTSSLGQ